MSDLNLDEPTFLGLECLEVGGDVNGKMVDVVRGMNNILNSSSALTWDEFYRIYTQWYELQCLMDA